MKQEIIVVGDTILMTNEYEILAYLSKHPEWNIDFTKKTIHFIALELANVGKMVITIKKENQELVQKEISIYLPQHSSNQQMAFVDLFENDIDDYKELTVYKNIKLENNVYTFDASKLNNRQMKDNLWHTKTKTKNKRGVL